MQKNAIVILRVAISWKPKSVGSSWPVRVLSLS